MSEMQNPLQDRTYLHERHRLSHQQIDRWLGENRSGEFLQEKLERLNTVKNFVMITDRLKENAIPFVCLKGPMLSYRIYGDASVRFSHDIDLLIGMLDLIPAISLMKENGYLIAEGTDWPTDKVRQDLMIRSSQHISLYNKKLRLSVELHWTITHTLPLPQNKISELIKNNLTTMVFSGRTFPVMNKEFELLFLLIHGARHEWCRLKWLTDINDYPMEDLDEKRFLDLAHQLKAERIIGQTSYFLKKYFNRQHPLPGGSIPPAYLIKHAQKAIEGEMHPESSTLMDLPRVYIYKNLLFRGLFYKIKVLNEITMTQTDVIQHIFSSKTAYYLYRPYSFIKRRVMHV